MRLFQVKHHYLELAAAVTSRGGKPEDQLMAAELVGSVDERQDVHRSPWCC